MKRCGTCKHWNPNEGSDSHCDWPVPVLPFWAWIANGDHQDYTQANDGKKCHVYQPSEE